jgi:hypothetical protein
MIKIEITDASTPFLIGTHFHMGNIFSIGHKSTHDLIDPEVENFELSVSNDKLYIENKKKGFFYKVNGKKISGKKNISIDSEIVFSSISFKVIDFQYDHIDHLTGTENAYKERIKETPELEEIFNLIEKDFIHLEKIKYDEK